LLSGLRDRVLSQKSPAAAAAALPKSDVGLRHFYEEKSKQQEAAASVAADAESAAAAQQLRSFARALSAPSAPRAPGLPAAASATPFRNLPKLCSFWLNGACTRVVKGTW
jgi:hypothetical protein